MSNVVPKKAAVKKVAAKNAIKLKLSFHLKYKTHFGQVIYLYGNHPALGNNLIEKAIPMVYLNDDYWVLHVEVEAKPTDKVEYHYFILNEDGTKAFAPADAAKLQRELPESVLNELELFLFGLGAPPLMDEAKKD